jgi:hypothetical protein
VLRSGREFLGALRYRARADWFPAAVLSIRGSRLFQSLPDAGPDGPFKIFVIGSGRSGTHWLGNILASYPSVHITVEKAPIFPWVVEMAQRPEMEPQLFPKLVRRYRAEHRAVLPRHYVDKSHPNLWIAEKLADEFPEARFIAIRRRLQGTVASMLKHAGVRRWAEAWDEDPRPNRFLGVTESLQPLYRSMSIAARCAVRVIAHSREIERLRAALGPKLHVLEYEETFVDPRGEFDRISGFFGWDTPPDVPMPNSASREKWVTQLSAPDQADIASVAKMMGAEAFLDSSL